jgi:hypothetical protein
LPVARIDASGAVVAGQSALVRERDTCIRAAKPAAPGSTVIRAKGIDVSMDKDREASGNLKVGLSIRESWRCRRL